MKARGALIPVILGHSICASAQPTSSPWEKFLEEPSKEVLAQLERAITSSGEERCDPSVAPSEEQSYRLFELIGAGSEPTFSAAFLVSQCWDGGLLEDFFRSAGAFFEKQPGAFLQIVIDRSVKESQLDYLLTMLPLETVDNVELRISIVQKRIDILKSVSEHSLEETKLKGLSLLERELSFLKEHRD